MMTRFEEDGGKSTIDYFNFQNPRRSRTLSLPNMARTKQVESAKLSKVAQCINNWAIDKLDILQTKAEKLECDNHLMSLVVENALVTEQEALRQRQELEDELEEANNAIEQHIRDLRNNVRQINHQMTTIAHLRDIIRDQDKRTTRLWDQAIENKRLRKKNLELSQEIKRLREIIDIEEDIDSDRKRRKESNSD